MSSYQFCIDDPAFWGVSLAATSGIKLYAVNEIVVNEHEKELGVSVIVAGSVILEKSESSGAMIEKQTLHVGEIFGETGLFCRAISPVTVIALEDSEILNIPHEFINGVINRNPHGITKHLGRPNDF